jgi:hypothetical protein
MDKFSKVAEAMFNIIMDIYGLDGEAEVTEKQGNAEAAHGNGTGNKSEK